MSKSPTPALDAIAAHGNRGHHGHLPNNIIICNDGTTFSVIAGNGTFSIPSPPRCECNSAGEAVVDSDSLSCDYLGPYQVVEVYTDDDELLEYGGYDPSDGDKVAVPFFVERLRQFVINHGGEYSPVTEAEEILRLTNNPRS